MIELAKKGRGFLPANEAAETFHRKMGDGEIVVFEPVEIRDLVAHRRYFGLMRLIANSCERIELPSGSFMEIRDEQDASTAIKICAGYVEWVLDGDGRPAFGIPKSISFRKMSKSEWIGYWVKVMAVVTERVLPGVPLPTIELEMLKCMGLAR